MKNLTDSFEFKLSQEFCKTWEAFPLDSSRRNRGPTRAWLSTETDLKAIWNEGLLRRANVILNFENCGEQWSGSWFIKKAFDYSKQTNKCSRSIFPAKSLQTQLAARMFLRLFQNPIPPTLSNKLLKPSVKWPFYDLEQLFSFIWPLLDQRKPRRNASNLQKYGRNLPKIQLS